MGSIGLIALSDHGEPVGLLATPLECSLATKPVRSVQAVKSVFFSVHEEDEKVLSSK